MHNCPVLESCLVMSALTIDVVANIFIYWNLAVDNVMALGLGVQALGRASMVVK